MRARAVLLVLVTLVAGACGSQPREATHGDTTTARPVVLSVEDVYAAGFTGEPVTVEGWLHAENGVVRLCSGFRESHPPQCVEPALPVEGLALASAAGLRQAAGVRWSDEPFRVRGRMDDGTLRAG